MFARFLGRPDVLDAAGGTDIFQMPTGRVKLSAGLNALQCVSLSAKVLRWYAGCCRTPIGNTAAAAGFPVVGLLHCFMDHEADGRSRDEALGLALCSLYPKSAAGPLPPGAPGAPSFGIFLRLISQRVGWWIGGLGHPDPFFDDRTKAPVAVPHVLAPNEREALAAIGS